MALELKKSFFRSIFTNNCYYLYHDAEGQAAHFSTIFIGYKSIANFYRSNFSAIDNDIVKYNVAKNELGFYIQPNCKESKQRIQDVYWKILY